MMGGWRMGRGDVFWSEITELGEEKFCGEVVDGWGERMGSNWWSCGVVRGVGVWGVGEGLLL